MQKLSEIRIRQPPIVVQRDDRFVVVCIAHLTEQEWYSAREYHLHWSGEWGIFPVSDDGDTGYFDTREEADEARLASEKGMPILHTKGNVAYLNASAWEACAQKARRLRA